MRTAALVLASMAIVQAIPASAASTTGIVRYAHTRQRIVALTFDDGPSPYTPQILAVLRRRHVPATFFVVGQHVRDDPGALRAEIRAGAVIGNHTYTHANLRWLTNFDIREQLRMTQRAVRAAGGVTPHWFRPPYDGVNSRVVSTASSLGLRTVTWSVDPTDWMLPGTRAIVARVLAGVRPGSVVLLHDGGGYRGETVRALPTIIRTLRRRGYRFVTLDGMFPSSPGCPARICADPR